MGRKKFLSQPFETNLSLSGSSKPRQVRPWRAIRVKISQNLPQLLAYRPQIPARVLPSRISGKKSRKLLATINPGRLQVNLAQLLAVYPSEKCRTQLMASLQATGPQKAKIALKHKIPNLNEKTRGLLVASLLT